MKAIKNKVQLIGHLGADPEIKIFKENNQLANMRLAVNAMVQFGSLVQVGSVCRKISSQRD